MKFMSYRGCSRVFFVLYVIPLLHDGHAENRRQCKAVINNSNKYFLKYCMQMNIFIYEECF